MDIHSLVATRLPGQPLQQVRHLGQGTDHLVYEVDQELIVRLPAGRPEPEEAASAVTREVALLAAVAAVTPLPVPEPVFVVPEAGCLAYRRLPGSPLLEVAASGVSPAAVAGALGRELSALHAVPPERWPDPPVDATPLSGWRDEAAAGFAEVAAEVPSAYRPAIDRFLAASPPPDGAPSAFSHNDLGIEHVLVDAGGTVTGVIDWSDAAVTDPASDFGRLYRDLGPAALATAIDHYHRSVPGLYERAVYYARCMVFEDLSYGLTRGRPQYVDKSFTALAWLFTGA